jgi:hypothetical protein
VDDLVLTLDAGCAVDAFKRSKRLSSRGKHVPENHGVAISRPASRRTFSCSSPASNGPQDFVRRIKCSNTVIENGIPK